jgi:prepilin-type N-terminal cleavage/methylation domain-containing protein
MNTNPNRTGRETANLPQSAFTFNELLVVIAVLGLLAMLILPALARTDDNGSRMVCIDNLRQMATAMDMYAGDNRDYFAYPNWDGGATGSPAGWLYKVGGAPALGTGIPNPYSPAAPYPMLNNGIQAWQTGLWFQYVRNFKSYLCPVDIESRTYLNPTVPAGRANKLSSYIMNGAIVNYNTGIPPCKLTDAWSPACYLLWEPDENAASFGNPGANEFNDGANFPSSPELIGRNHSANAGNMLSVGGNVSIVTVRTWNAQTVVGSGSGPGGKTFAWWAPLASNGN